MFHSECSTQMSGAALRGARDTLRAHPARRPSSSFPAVLRSSRIYAMRSGPVLVGALISAADRAILRRTSGAEH